MSGYRARARDPSEYRSSQHEGRRTSTKDRSEYSQGGSSSPPRRTSQKYSTASRNEDLRPFSYGILPQQRKEGRDSSPSQQWEEPVNRGASSFNTDPSSRAFREMGSSEYERRPSNIKRSVPAEKESDISPLKPRNVLSGIVQEPSFTARQRPTRTSQQQQEDQLEILAEEQWVEGQGANPEIRQRRGANLAENPQTDETEQEEVRDALNIDKDVDLAKIKGLPTSIKIKRHVLETRIHSIRMTKFNRSFLDVVDKMVAGVKKLDFFKRSVLHTEKKFGSGAASFFKLLKRFIFQNLIVSLAVIAFLLLPFILRTDNQRASFHVTDLFTGEGYLETSELFYGSYYNSNGTYDVFWPNYLIQDVYFYTILVSYLFYIIVCGAFIVNSYTEMYTDRMDNFTRQFGALIFSGWEMSIDDMDCASAIREKNIRSLREMLKKKGQRSKPKLENTTLLIRCAVSLLVTGVLAGVGFGMYKLREAEKTDEAVYIIPLVFQGIMLLLPWLFSVISQLEKWSAQDGIFVRLTRSFLLAGVMLGVIIVFSLSQNQDQDQDQDQHLNQVQVEICFETRIGQEIYRILVYFFLVILLLNLMLETVWNILTRFGFNQLGSPVFDIPRNTSYLLYSQMITWLGFYYSPLLPIVQTILLVFMFYLKQFSLNYNCRASPKIWSNSSIQFFYQVLSMLSLLVSLVPYGFVLTQIDSSRSCGPFSNQNQTKPLYAMKFLQQAFLFQPTFVAFFVVVALIICYYARSLAISRKRYGKTLSRQLKMAVKELKILKDSLK